MKLSRRAVLSSLTPLLTGCAALDNPDTPECPSQPSVTPTRIGPDPTGCDAPADATVEFETEETGDEVTVVLDDLTNADSVSVSTTLDDEARTLNRSRRALSVSGTSRADVIAVYVTSCGAAREVGRYVVGC